MTFQGPGPRSDGNIYVVDYGAIFYPPVMGGTPTPFDSTAAIQMAEDDAGLIGTYVIWPAGVVKATNLNVPPGVINVGKGSSFTGMGGTTISGGIIGAVFNLTAPSIYGGGPYYFEGFEIYAGSYGIYSAKTINRLVMNDVGIVASDTSLYLASRSNYPVLIDLCNFNGGNYGIYSADHLGSADITHSVFAGHKKAGISLNRETNNVSDDSIELDHLIFNNVSGPIVYINAPVTRFKASFLSTENYTGSLSSGAISFGPNGGGSNIHISDSVLGGPNYTYAMDSVPESTVLINVSLGSPLNDPNHHATKIATN